ncbi:MAG: hypothetical protein IPN18_18000 [Ignavibacteriales bacterium]|nr:hypothetical protein [Ignavibacteriales bacterium]
MYQHGIKILLLLRVTALTDDQVKLFPSYTKHFYLLFDSDAAGYKVTVEY